MLLQVQYLGRHNDHGSKGREQIGTRACKQTFVGNDMVRVPRERDECVLRHRSGALCGAMPGVGYKP